MPLIECPECAAKVSTAAHACPSCGYPVAEKLSTGNRVSDGTSSLTLDEVLMEIRPSWWGYFWYLFFFWLIVPPIIGWWKRGSVVLKVYRRRITLERGRFAKCQREFMIKDIRSVDIDESFLDRIVGIGDLTIATAAATDAAENIRGIPHPRKVRDLIMAERENS
jgi:uncharacterized membrane protein YdbT with pleckstrin-like domain